MESTEVAPGRRVLIVEDDCDVSEFYAFLLQRAGYVIATAPDGRIGLQRLVEFRPDVVVCDVMMPEMDGLEFLRRLPSTVSPAPPVVSNSGFDSCEKHAMAQGAFMFLQKPVDANDLVAAVDTAIRRVQMDKNTVAQRREHVRARRERAVSDAAAFMARIDVDHLSIQPNLDALVAWVRSYFGFGTAFVNLFVAGTVRVQAVSGEAMFARGMSIAPDRTYCAEVGSSGSSLLLNDARLSPSFCNHPAALAGFHFYAGIPLTMPDGVVVGSLCLTDRETHEFAAENMQILEHIARALSRRLALLSGRPANGELLFSVPGLFGRETLHVIIGAELRLANRSGGAVELAIVELGKMDADAGDGWIADLYERIHAPRFVIGRFGRTSLALFARSTHPHAAAETVERALHAVRACAPVEGAGIVSHLGAPGASMLSENELERLADEARARALTRGDGAVERVALRGGEEPSAQPSAP